MTDRIYTMKEFAEMLSIGMAVQLDIHNFKKVEDVEAEHDPQKRRDAKAAFIANVCRLPADKATSDEIDKVFVFAREASRLRADIATREFRKRFGISLTCEASNG